MGLRLRGDGDEELLTRDKTREVCDSRADSIDAGPISLRQISDLCTH